MTEAHMWLCLACAQDAGLDEEVESTRPERAGEMTYVGGGYNRDSRGNYRENFYAGTP